MKRLLFLLLLAGWAGTRAGAAEWQWRVATHGIVSAETGHEPDAYLWIPSTCERVRAVIIGQHNMSEETLFENPLFRQWMEELDFAIVWITPILDMPWDVSTGCNETLFRALAELAAASGYEEIATAPVIPIGHSALATFPWNFAAWNPERTLAVVSLHGDAPRTNLTGYGRANLEWGRTRNIDGIPGLMIEGEYEWWEDRVRPALDFRMMYPASCISFLGDAGRGHFDVGDETAEYIARFLAKAAKQRLGTPLRAVNSDDGWLAERWHPEQERRAEAAPAAQYSGNRHEAFWYFDREIACMTEACYAATRRKQPLVIGYEYEGAPIPYNEQLHARMRCTLHPEADGRTFRLRAFFSDSLRQHPAAERPAGEPEIRRISGPVEVVDDTTLRVCFGRGTIGNPRRGREIWIAAEHPGDRYFKGAVQQLLVELPIRNTGGRRQSILFPSLPDIRTGEAAPALQARSDCGLPVAYFVKEGPAEVVGGALRLTPIPPRSRYPIRVSVVAWQYGLPDSVQSAEPVERIFYINR